MSTVTEQLIDLVSQAIAPIYRRAIKPETTYAFNGGDIPGRGPLPHEKLDRRFAAKHPLAPRDRLSARLAMLCALTECQNRIMKDILSDAEAVADAKLHGEP